MRTLEERVEALELAIREIREAITDAIPSPSLEDLHAATEAKVKLARERGGLRA